MPPVLRCGTVFCLRELTSSQKIYTKGDGNFGSAFTIANTPAPPSLGGDDVYWGSFHGSNQGESWLILASEWAQDETTRTIFGTIVRLGTNWPPNIFDILLVEVLGAGNVQAGIYLEASSGDVYLVDSTGAQVISLADPLFIDEPFLIVAMVELQNSGASWLRVYNMAGSLVAFGTASGTDFQTATGLTLTMKLQGQNHGGDPLANPTLTLMMNPFVMDGSTSSVDIPRRMAGLFWVCSDGDDTPPFQYNGSPTSPQVASAGVWSDTDDELGGTDVEYDDFGTGGMNVVDGPLDDSRLGPSTRIFGGGICIHTDSDLFDTSSTDVSAGRYPGSGSVQDIINLQGAAYGGGFTGIHGTTLIVDNLVYGDQLVAGHRSNDSINPRTSKINAMRGWALVDWSTFVSPSIAVLRRRIEGHV